MLDYLVTSPARRRLLSLLWGEHGRGSATTLARDAHVSFATAYRELRAMVRHGLATETFERGVAVFAANVDHPLASELAKMVTWRSAGPAAANRGDDALRAQLAEHGAPVNAETAASDAPLSLEDLVARGVALARRDPAAARALPVMLHKVSKQLDVERLRLVSRARGVGHAAGFMLALTGSLARDVPLIQVAQTLRDRRVRRQPFFVTPVAHAPIRFPLAARWGFTLATSEEDFASTFRRFAKADR
jgi:Fe2+ or Zn2+ uptake regulation protein